MATEFLQVSFAEFSYLINVLLFPGCQTDPGGSRKKNTYVGTAQQNLSTLLSPLPAAACSQQQSTAGIGVETDTILSILPKAKSVLAKQ